jgi:hypothetical protein
MEMDISLITDPLLSFGAELFEAIKKVFGVALLGIIILFLAEKTVIRRHIVTDILPMWSMLMAYFLTLKGRLQEIERTSQKLFLRLGLPEQDAESSASRELWLSSAPGSLRFQLKQALQENKLSAEETHDLFAAVITGFVKLKNDVGLFRAYSNHLTVRMQSLWSEKLHIVSAIGGGVESVPVIKKEAAVLEFYIERHMEILMLYMESYVAGNRDGIICENLANYWPYFLGQPDRLLVTAREDFLTNHLGERERKTRTLRGRIEFIEEALDEARKEISRKIRKELPAIEVGTIWGSGKGEATTK